MRSASVFAALSAVFQLAQPALAEEPAYSHPESVGLITTLGPTGLFQNPTSGIVPKGAFTFESCLGFKESAGEHFTAHGTLVTYGVTDWLELSGYLLYAYDIGPDNLHTTNLNARARLVRETGVLPEVSLGGMVGFGDDPLTSDNLFLAASKGFSLSSGSAFRTARLHGGVRQSWPEAGEEVTIGFVGLEIEALPNVFLVGEVNTKDNIETPWSLGMQYKSNAFGLSASVLQAGNETDPTYFVGIGVSY